MILPGIGGMIGGVGELSLAFVASAVTDGTSCTVPATALAGDLGVLLDYAKKLSNAIPTDVVPSGWTGIVTDGATAGGTAGGRVRASYKILTALDVGAGVTGMNDDRNPKVMFVFRPSRGIASVTASSWNAEVNGGNPTSQTVSASGQVTPLVVLGFCAEGDNNAEFSTASPAFDGEVETAAGTNNAGYKIYNSAPANHSIDMNDLGAINGLASGYLIVS